ncbi:hypothetical protein, conserved [Trypanosoma brucei brucei TREU927]|uniref:Uncharacterized protein n=1 Tax=Trypanosoma brucei brucei (strain 927/4 GUTat10.1) TaxID=185431 RepID=Q38CB2_TRYB2|nr:hypothetical protein, conserved [Trypanosoma brucei brucei TREU927]EAN77558.1 hypothetical protein, conserved [Trypanosoma brucei brucei TREU927]
MGMRKKETIKKAHKPGVAKGLSYRRPWATFVPTLICFLLLNYLAFGTTVDEEGTDLVVPSGLGDNNTSSLSKLQLLFEDRLMRSLFRVGLFMFREMKVIQLVAVLAFVIHCGEAGLAAGICIRCKADRRTFGLYTVLTLLGGATQLGPLFEAEKDYLKDTTNITTKDDVSKKA